MNNKPWRSMGALLLAMMAVWLLVDWWQAGRELATVPYSQFETELRDGQFSEVQVGDRTIIGTLRTPRDGKTHVAATRVEPALAERLAPTGVTYSRLPESGGLTTLLGWLVPPLLFFGLWTLANRRLMGRGGAGLLGIGQSKAKVYMEPKTGVTFDDVAGVDEAKAELQEVVDFLRNPKEHGRLGARMPKGVLLMGPTGTGKTLLARAVAGEAGVAFFSISGSEFIEMFVGVGAARVRDLFEQARANAPAIIFIDELDALGKARGAGSVFGAHDEREQTLNQLLVELDGFDPSVGVVLLAATNRPEILDPALLRAGRFDRQVLVDKPDRAGRVAILKVHAKKVKLAPDVDLDQVAAITVGFAGADLANLVNEAALVATRRNGDSVMLADFTHAIERIVAGIEKKNRLLTPQERLTVAYHEMGHALTALALPGADKVHKVSIVPHGIGALGYTMQRPTEDRYLMRRGELVDKMTVQLGGRAAELLAFGELSTGAADDIVRATELARSMVVRYGMDERLGPVAYADDRPAFLAPPDGLATLPTRFGPETAQRIDTAVRELVQHALGRASEILTRHRGVLDRCAQALLERETLDEGEIEALTQELRAPSPAARQPQAIN
ncbi:MAG TPA: ATP-dependent zinc metalloprotease FtsH [Ideonella sp.]|nr:ATP-dependent zinc metalloprotease FtsH [Ideonella sp.]